jgi:hypothetical protein
MSQKGIETDDSIKLDSALRWRTTQRSCVKIRGQHVPFHCNYAPFASCQMASTDIENVNKKRKSVQKETSIEIFKKVRIPFEKL